MAVQGGPGAALSSLASRGFDTRRHRFSRLLIAREAREEVRDVAHRKVVSRITRHGGDHGRLFGEFEQARAA